MGHGRCVEKKTQNAPPHWDLQSNEILRGGALLYSLSSPERLPLLSQLGIVKQTSARSAADIRSVCG